jgi:hypothetical protein
LFAAGIETDLIDARVPRWVNPCLARYRDVVLRVLERSEQQPHP